MDLLSMDIYAIEIIRPNRIGLSVELKDTKSIKNSEQVLVQK